MKQCVTIYDISKKSGVSTATVSRVLNGSDAVSEKTREKVLRVMKECGYTPNAFARGLGLKTMKTIGLLCADISDSFMAQAISYLEKDLRRHDYDSLLCCTGFQRQDRQKGLNLLISKHVDGVILVGSDYVSGDPKQNAYILDAARKRPITVLNARLDGENIYCAYCDDRAATQEATAWLLENGSRRVLYLYHAHSFSGTKKLEGYKMALANAGQKVDNELLLECGPEEGLQHIEQRIAEAAGRGAAFDAVMTATDDMAVAALKYARTAKRRVPQEMQIIGFNDSALCLCLEKELTSVDNKLRSLCATCVTNLMGVLDGQEMPKHSVFSGELVFRDTTR